MFAKFPRFSPSHVLPSRTDRCAAGALLAALLLVALPLGAVEFERMPVGQYYQTINKAHKAYRGERMEEALALYNLTARWGEKSCQRQLGVMLLTGVGTEVDLVEGMAWLILAAESKNSEDLSVLKQARQQVPEEAQLAAKELAEEYREQFGARATGMKCKRVRQRDSGRKENVCERPTGSMSDSMVEVPVVDSQYYWAIEG